MSDTGDAITLERMYKKYAGFGGIQGFEFVETINDFDSDKWTALAGITYGDTVHVDSTAAERIGWYDDPMPHSYLLEFTVHQYPWSILVRGDGAASYYRIDYDDQYITISKTLNGTLNRIEAKAISGTSQVTTKGRIKVSVRDEQADSDTTGRIIHIAVWINDYLLYTFDDFSGLVNPPLRMAFIIPFSAVVGNIYSDIRVANMGEVIPVSSLDPSEYPMSAISRAIEDRYIRSWIRWNGKLKAWRPISRPVSASIAASRSYQFSPTTDARQLFTHLRILGAFQWVQVKDNDLIRDYGHRFEEISNTALWNTDDCYRIGLEMFVRTKEQAFQAQIQTTGLPYIELEDRISLPDRDDPDSTVDYIVDNVQWQAVPNTYNVSITGRKYYYGEVL